MKFLIFLIITILLPSPAFCQTKPINIIFRSSQTDTPTKQNETKKYILKMQAVNCDFNYSKLNDIDGNIKDV